MSSTAAEQNKLPEKAIVIEGPTQCTLIMPKSLTRRIGLKHEGYAYVTQQQDKLIIEGAD